MSPETPKNPGAGETHEVKGTSPEKQKKDQKLMDQLLSGLPGYKPKTEKAKQGAKAVEKKNTKLKKGTAEYKKRLAELTDIDIGPNDKLKNVKIAGEGMTKEQIAGKQAAKAPNEALAKKSTKQTPSSGTPKRKGLA
jgi:hypothetical protein